MAEGMTDDLVAFLRARLDEDEALARGAEGGKGPHGYFAVTGWCYFDADWGDILPADLVNDSDAWKPARVLAEVQAKRRIIEEHGPRDIASLERESWGQLRVVCRICALPGERRVVHPCPTLRLLALPYASHSDYRAEWAPTEEASRG